MNKRARKKFLVTLRTRSKKYTNIDFLTPKDKRTRNFLKFTKRIYRKYGFYVRDDGSFSFGEPPAFQQMREFAKIMAMHEDLDRLSDLSENRQNFV